MENNTFNFNLDDVVGQANETALNGIFIMTITSAICQLSKSGVKMIAVNVTAPEFGTDSKGEQKSIRFWSMCEGPGVSMALGLKNLMEALGVKVIKPKKDGTYPQANVADKDKGDQIVEWIGKKIRGKVETTSGVDSATGLSTGTQPQVVQIGPVEMPQI